VPRPAAILALGLSATLTLTACKPDTVRLAFRPGPGRQYSYEVRVESVTVTTLGDAAPRRTSSSFVLRADQEVVRTVGTMTEVRVRLAVVGGAPEHEATTLLVRLDRAAQLADVERIEGLPTNVLGQLGLAEIFPAAAGAPPDRALSPGDRWAIDEPLRLSGGEDTRLRGFGRLSQLDVAGGRKVATVESSYQLPVRRLAPEDPKAVVLNGTQSTSTRTTHELDDGSIRSAHSRSRGEFQLALRPPNGQAGPTVRGSLVVEVRSTTTRLS
jgi:hypothetical protein